MRGTCKECRHWAGSEDRPVGAGPGGRLFGPLPDDGSIVVRECRVNAPSATVMLTQGLELKGPQPMVMAFAPLVPSDYWCGKMERAPTIPTSPGLAPLRMDPNKQGGLSRAPTVEEMEAMIGLVDTTGAIQIPLDGPE